MTSCIAGTSAPLPFLLPFLPFLIFIREGGGGGREGERGTGGERKRESTMSAKDNALNKTFRELGLSKHRGKTEKIEISM